MFSCFLGTCVFVGVYVGEWTLPCGGCGNQRLMSVCLLQFLSILFFCERISHWIWSLLFWLDWLVCESLASICFSLHVLLLRLQIYGATLGSLCGNWRCKVRFTYLRSHTQLLILVFYPLNHRLRPSLLFPYILFSFKYHGYIKFFWLYRIMLYGNLITVSSPPWCLFQVYPTFENYK